mgnify:CR=1 FL=1
MPFIELITFNNTFLKNLKKTCYQKTLVFEKEIEVFILVGLLTNKVNDEKLTYIQKKL